MIQVLDNLMNDAMECSPDGGTITGKMEKRTEFPYLSVSVTKEWVSTKADLSKDLLPFLPCGQGTLTGHGRERLAVLGYLQRKSWNSMIRAAFGLRVLKAKVRYVYLSLFLYVPYEEEEWE
ncbi:MAG: hypothetical protein U5K84_12200 [Alkalibacterium sp.]|nr:hypothetical protein [Alkalibacterium sp.]